MNSEDKSSNSKLFSFEKQKWINLLGQWQLHIMILPALLLLIVFKYFPMWGVLLSFKDYDIFKGFLASEWVGFKHFIDFFNSRVFWTVMRNTIVISVLRLIFTMAIPILLAIIINEVRIKSVKRIYQTISYLPHFVSWIIISGLVVSLLSAEGGSVNILLEKIGLINEPINWMSEPNYFWAIFTSVTTWKVMGYRSIIFLAAIAGINPNLYDAASVDGASRFQKIIKITIPSIIPVIIILLVLAIGQLLSGGYQQILALTNMGRNTILRDVSETIGTYVYRVGITNFRYSFASAIGLFQSVINIVLLLTANKLAKKISGNGLW
jgi:putative aldouronate transport system permease protein